MVFQLSSKASSSALQVFQRSRSTLFMQNCELRHRPLVDGTLPMPAMRINSRWRTHNVRRQVIRRVSGRFKLKTASAQSPGSLSSRLETGVLLESTRSRSGSS
jgi:hypothetical protein